MGGENYYQRFTLPKYISNNIAVCDISSYKLSSDPSSIVEIPSLVLDELSSLSEVFIDEPFNNSFNDTEFYLHVETSGGDHSAKFVS